MINQSNKNPQSCQNFMKQRKNLQKFHCVCFVLSNTVGHGSCHKSDLDPRWDSAGENWLSTCSWLLSRHSFRARDGTCVHSLSIEILSGTDHVGPGHAAKVSEVLYVLVKLSLEQEELFSSCLPSILALACFPPLRAFKNKKRLIWFRWKAFLIHAQKYRRCHLTSY